MTQESKPSKVKVSFTRVDHTGLQNGLREMNALIEQGYRFTLSDLLADKPNFRTGHPSFSMSLEGHAEPAPRPEYDPTTQPPYYKDMEVLDTLLERLSTLVKKEELVAFAEEVRIHIPVDNKMPASIKKWLSEQLSAYRR